MERGGRQYCYSANIILLFSHFASKKHYCNSKLKKKKSPNAANTIRLTLRLILVVAE